MIRRTLVSCAAGALALLVVLTPAVPQAQGRGGPPAQPGQQGGLPALAARVQALEVAVADLSDASSALGADLRARIDALGADLAALDVELQGQIDGLQQLFESLNPAVNTAQQDIADLRGRVATLEEILETGLAQGAGEVQVDTGAPTPYTFDLRRYVVEVTPSQVGRVVRIPSAITDAFCRDVDGCRVTVSMVNYDASGQPGLPATREARLFISQTSRWWRFSNDLEGRDNDGGVHEWAVFDCLFTDAETAVNSANGRRDDAGGFGLLNVRDGGYPDPTTICRVAVQD